MICHCPFDYRPEQSGPDAVSFGDAEVYKDPDRIAALQRDYDAKTAELKLLYRAYERRME